MGIINQLITGGHDIVETPGFIPGFTFFGKWRMIPRGTFQPFDVEPHIKVAWLDGSKNQLTRWGPHSVVILDYHIYGPKYQLKVLR